MLCDACRDSGTPGFVRTQRQLFGGAARVLVPCPECGGHGIAHCCDGVCTQPDPQDGPEAAQGRQIR
jgi:DnaJ-class molecular chaperone